jgi:hypothetical protein
MTTARLIAGAAIPVALALPARASDARCDATFESLLFHTRDAQ